MSGKKWEREKENRGEVEIAEAKKNINLKKNRIADRKRKNMEKKYVERE